jgi:ABC-type sugar transport system ATPase subunit
MIELDNITIHSGSFSLSAAELSIPAATYAVLMGGTGQGKTTILEAICGLRRVTTGQILLNGVEVTRWKPADRGVGYVPQDLALFPTMTVQDHLEFALRLRRASAAMIRDRVDRLARVLGIQALLHRRVRGLSGGEAQRVALGRALSFQPRVLLLDEPLNALDESTRDRLIELLRSVQRENELTTLHVTHSRVEARALADKLIVLEAGRLREAPLTELDRISEPVPDSPKTTRSSPSPSIAGSTNR